MDKDMDETPLDDATPDVTAGVGQISSLLGKAIGLRNVYNQMDATRDTRVTTSDVLLALVLWELRKPVDLDNEAFK